MVINNSLEIDYSQGHYIQISSIMHGTHFLPFTEEQRKISDKDDTLFFESKKDFKSIILKTTTMKSFISFYEALEYKKLYKYSVPFFYETGEKFIDDLLKEMQIVIFDNEIYQPEYVIDRNLNESVPSAYVEDGIYFIKFVLQKAYLKSDTFEQIDYR